MPFSRLIALVLGAGCAILMLGLAGWGDEQPRTGPETEKRFPPLKVPAGFKATLFACDPLVEYPSAIAAGPRPGALLVATDYMTGLGTEIVRRDEVRFLEDTDGDGYADKATVFAKGFNSIQGLAYHDGTLYVMHAPYLSALRDTKGAGTADERRDLLAGLGLTPEQNPVRLHCANGVTVGHDGWLYLALGDHGCDVERPEGDRLVLHGGGILRCRPDGRDLHVFATGLRNIYDVALDAALNVFVRDNENDGGTYMIRVCHSFAGADHGYPYLYAEHPDEALTPLADLGLGSSAGGLCYNETQFPPEYRGNLFFCEWGRSVVRYQPRPAGSGFGPLKEIEFAAGAANDPYGFRPTDLVVQRDGALIVADWADGQRPRRGRGRLYRIAPTGNTAKPQPPPDLRKMASAECVARLDRESYYERWDAQVEIERRGGPRAVTDLLAKGRLGVRGRLHAVWILARAGDADRLFRLAKADPDPVVRAQAVRALADLADPVLTRHRLDAGPGDADFASRLAALGQGADPRILREVVIAVGRMRWTGTAAWLQDSLSQPDSALAHAAMQALRRSGNWPAVLKLLDEPDNAPMRPIAVRAAADRYDIVLVDGLVDRLRKEGSARRRQEYAEMLARVYKKPGPWTYWGYRPPPRPANTSPWDRSEDIRQALNRALADPDRGVRLAVLRRMQREKVPAETITLARWLSEERRPEAVAVLLATLRGRPANEVHGPLDAVVRNREYRSINRLSALSLLAEAVNDANGRRFVELAAALEDGPVLAEALRQVGKRPGLKGSSLLKGKLASGEPLVRAAAVEGLATQGAAEGKDASLHLLKDRDARVRRAAAVAAGALRVHEAVESLLALARDPDAGVRRACLEALRLLREARAAPVAVAALADRETVLSALECLRVVGGPEQAGAVADLVKRERSTEVLAGVIQILTAWAARDGVPVEQRAKLERAVAEVHGTAESLLGWQVAGPLSVQEAAAIAEKLPPALRPADNQGVRWRTLTAAGAAARANLGKPQAKDSAYIGYADAVVPEKVEVEFLASAAGTLRVWLNGRSVYARSQAQPFRPDSDRFTAVLDQGPNRLVVRVASPGKAVEFHLRFRRKSSSAEQERLIQAALTRPGNAERGRTVFFDAEKSLCLKCHRIRDKGERIGPELTGVGSRFSRAYIIESILQPSRTVATGFETVTIVLKNGRVLTGVKAADTETALTLADNQGQKHELKKADIDEQQPLPTSTMPEGLEKRLTEQEFVDLIAFLVSRKEPR